jgi:predicted secreted protein
MPAEKGSAFLLKVGNGATPVVYATVAGLRTTQLSINGELVAITSKESGGWRDWRGGGGGRSARGGGGGVFTGSAAETRIKGNALSGALDDYRLSFESGDPRGARGDHGECGGGRSSSGAATLEPPSRARGEGGVGELISPSPSGEGAGWGMPRRDPRS